MPENGEHLSIIHFESFPFIPFWEMDTSSQNIAKSDKKTDKRIATNIHCADSCVYSKVSPAILISFRVASSGSAKIV
jgi:hypothetical protein